MTDRPEEFGNKVRVGADFDAVTNAGEVTRIDFDTDHGKYGLVVERLGSQGVIIIDLFPYDETGQRGFASWRIAEYPST